MSYASCGGVMAASIIMGKTVRQMLRESAIDEAVRRTIFCEGLSIKESAQVCLRNPHLLPDIVFPEVIFENNKKALIGYAKLYMRFAFVRDGKQVNVL